MKALDRKLLVESNILPNEKPELSEEQTEEKNSKEWSENMTGMVLDNKRTKVEFEEELNKIASKDDSIEPEIMKDQNSTIQDYKDIIKAEKKKSVSLTDVFNKAQEAKLKQRDQQHKEHEDNKERRHQEKLQLLKDLFKNS
ncbi:unnamed protein product [Psylliodes chrysocephalus]|uniref:Uncharacterized protein n=1 Tax=Psylliodes chrysocephalus TaxID=3402493 RepID=A0A9P0GAF1_9CUCU|nr:unnamed protein product [Psylliodes chrysocephala]